jgi:VIT1/CCC1 family predicted Fe2+/Mn2+ transporter
MSETPVVHEPASSAPRDVARHYIGDLVYGANDGLVTTFAVVSGVAGADLAPRIVLILGVANLLADGFSMGASGFLAIRSSAAADGQSRGIREPLSHAGATFLAFLVAGVLPLLAYALAGSSFAASAAVTGAMMFAAGAARSLVTPRGWLRCGLEMFLVGATAAAVAYGIGAWLATLKV